MEQSSLCYPTLQHSALGHAERLSLGFESDDVLTMDEHRFESQPPISTKSGRSGFSMLFIFLMAVQ